MNISPEARIVSKVVALVVRVLIDHDVVGIPQPVAGVPHVGIRNREVEVAETEAGWAASGESPDVLGAETSAEVAMLPRMIEVEADIGAAGIVADPLLLINVGCFGMALAIREMLL